MIRLALSCSLFSLVFMACSSRKTLTTNTSTEPKYTVQSLELQDTASLSMVEQPLTENGSFILKPGLYTAEFKSYCLQPGTPDPTARDAYFQAPLNHPRKEIIESILKIHKPLTSLIRGIFSFYYGVWWAEPNSANYLRPCNTPDADFSIPNRFSNWMGAWSGL